MKTLTCQICGSTHLVKEDGMYLCQSCGTTYSIDDDIVYANLFDDEENLEQKAEVQEELKRLHKLVKDDPTLYERIYELDYGDWEAYYYHYTVKCKFIYESDDINWDYLSRTFDRLKERVSSDSEIKTCIKDVIYKDFKEWADSKFRYYIENYKKEDISMYGDKYENLSRMESKIVFCSNKMKQLKNRIISIFGENFSDFADELKNDFDKLIEQRRSDIYIIKEEREKEIDPPDNSEKSSKRISTWVLVLIVIGLFLIAGGGSFFYYKNVYLPEKRDAEAPRYYVMAQNLNMRSTPEFEADYNKIGSFPYGTEIIIYDSVKAGMTWYFYGKYAPKDAKGKTKTVVEGYLAYDFMASKADFFLLNSIFGNEDARKMLSEVRYKKALLNYFKQHGYRGDISRDQIEKYGISNNYSTAERWQVFCKYEKAKSNNVYRSRKYRKDSKYADAAIIIKNIDNGERRLLYYVFDDDETPHLLLEQNVPNNGYMKDGTLKLKQYYGYMNYGEYFVEVEYQYDDFL